jgi:hypothetical protein
VSRPRRQEPLLGEIESLKERIAEYDRRIRKIAKVVRPEVTLLKQVKGVGTLISSRAVQNNLKTINNAISQTRKLFMNNGIPY